MDDPGGGPVDYTVTDIPGNFKATAVRNSGTCASDGDDTRTIDQSRNVIVDSWVTCSQVGL